MRSAYFEQFSDDDRAVLRRRATGFLLALAVEALLVIVLLTLNPPQFGQPRGDNRPKTFTLTPDREERKAAKKQQQQRHAATTKSQTPPPKTPLVPPPLPLTDIPGMITLKQKDYVASNIGNIKSQKAPGSANADDGDTSGDSVAIGGGPHGEPLYQAEWYREPTDAQTGPYIPKNLAGGASALIACKTAPRYHVEDCVILGEDPPGTGLARGIRNAAFQFLVIPPRKGGNPMIGAWVRIRFDITERERR